MRVLLPVIFMTFLAHFAFSQTTDDNSTPFVLGRIERIKSTVLSEDRVLNIYLPEGYNPKDTIRYPVVYLLDGSADEDFIHVTGIFQFNNFAWIDRVPKSIIVGIANVDRKRDFTFETTIESEKKKLPTSGHSEKFIRFLEQELQPFIEKKFKTKSSKTLIGQSLAALLATEVLLKKPALFDKYIIISPSMWWDNGSLFNLKPAALHKKTDVYIAVGKEGLAPSAQPHVMEVDANLLFEKLQQIKSPLLQVHFDYLPGEDHATITHQAVFNALRALYPVK
ncbi:alpha/beta hydrolase [Dyadobacter luteus]|uniref:Alpha/beta hydrolase n=2 Tax=Dyadobacter luteus TaxID=2259619 RepID=A0A3D8Y4V1_9BACT|nr:alpha/beta hydrolase [Dyadobacter luteus]